MFCGFFIACIVNFSQIVYCILFLGGWTKTVLYRPNSVKHSHHGQGVQTLNYVTHERSRSTYPAPVPRGRVGGRYVPGGIDAPRGEQVTRMFMDGASVFDFLLVCCYGCIMSYIQIILVRIDTISFQWLLVVFFKSVILRIFFLLPYLISGKFYAAYFSERQLPGCNHLLKYIKSIKLYQKQNT